MKKLILLLYLIFFFFTGYSQKFLCIDIYRLGGVNRLRIYPNQKMVYKLISYRGIKKNIISDLRDSSIFFENGQVIQLKDIKIIYADVSNILSRSFFKAGIKGGMFLVAIDGFNHLINHEPQIMNQNVGIVAGSMFVSGLLVKWLCTKHIRPGKNKTLKIIDFTMK